MVCLLPSEVGFSLIDRLVREVIKVVGAHCFFAGRRVVFQACGFMVSVVWCCFVYAVCTGFWCCLVFFMCGVLCFGFCGLFVHILFTVFFISWEFLMFVYGKVFFRAVFSV